MIVLDTDHVSFLQRRDSDVAQVISQRLATCDDRDIVTTVITVEEQMRGWLSIIARYHDFRHQVGYYDELVSFLRYFQQWRILSVDGLAVAEFDRLRKRRIRIGTNDLKIAAITLANDATLISRNLRDFKRVPELRVEDWSA